VSIPDGIETKLRRALVRSAVLAVSAASIGGCKSCSDRKPYTPYSTGSGTTTSVTTSPAPSAGAFAPLAGVAADGTTFDLDGTPVEAPGGKRFVSALTVDADGDGSKDLVAWIAPLDMRGGELVYVSGKDRAVTSVAKLPPLGDGTPCKPSVALNLAGPSTVTANVAPGCDAAAGASDVKTYFAVLRMTKGAPLALRLDGTLGASAPGESLSVELDPKDRDDDGVDDLKLTVTLDGLGDPFDLDGKVSIPVLYLDRPAGFARDTSEPDATLTSLAASVIAKARMTKTAPSALGDAARLIRLGTATCEELGAPSISTSAGKMRCGDTSFVADAIYGVGLAAITTKDYGSAIASYELLQKIKGDKHKHAADLDKALAKAAPIVTPTTLHTIAAKPATGVLSPLAFDADGNLLVVGDGGTTQVSAQSFAEDTSQAAPWPLTLAWRNAGMQFNVGGASRSCSPRGLTFQGKIGDSSASAILPSVEAALPTKLSPCADGPVPFSPLVGIDNGFVIAAGSSVFKIESQGSGIHASASLPPDSKAPPSLPGQSRSFDGSAIVLPISGGVLVLTDKGPKRWMSDDLKDAKGCVVKNGGARVACVTPKGAVLVESKP